MVKAIKRLGYAFSALVLVGASMGGMVRVFADELNAEDGETSAILNVDTEGGDETNAGGGADAIRSNTTSDNINIEDEGVGVNAGVQLRAAALPAQPDAGEESGALRAAPVPEAEENNFLAEVGDTVDLELAATISTLHGNSCTINGVTNGSEEVGATCDRKAGTVVVSKTGIYQVRYTYTLPRQYRPTNYDATIVVYDVAAEEGTAGLSEEDSAKLVNFVTEQLRALLAAGEDENQYVSLAGWDVIWSALVESESPRFTVSAVVGEDESHEASDEVAAEIKDSETEAIRYGGYVDIAVDGELVGGVYELESPVTMQLAIPEEYREAPAGITRTWSVIRGHVATDGTRTAERLTAIRDGDNLSVDNGKFSTFVLVYEDTAEETSSVKVPDTGAATQEAGSVSASFAPVAFVGAMAALAYVAVKFAKN